jgi:hypothetical protein
MEVELAATVPRRKMSTRSISRFFFAQFMNIAFLYEQPLVLPQLMHL